MNDSLNRILSNDVITRLPTIGLVHDIKNEIENNGFYCLRNSVDEEIISKCKYEIEEHLQLKGRRYFSLINPCNNLESIFSVFNKSINLSKFLNELARLELSGEIELNDTLNVLRIVTGKSADSQALNFHYDASVITALIPIIIPKGSIDECGHLLAFKNLRNIRKYALFNFIEKLLIQNFIVKRIISSFAKKNLNKLLIELEEGNIYFFHGYRTLHANLPVNSDYLRATLLFHVGNPHSGSKIINLIANVRHMREKNNAKH